MHSTSHEKHKQASLTICFTMRLASASKNRRRAVRSVTYIQTGLTTVECPTSACVKPSSDSEQNKLKTNVAQRNVTVSIKNPKEASARLAKLFNVKVCS